MFWISIRKISSYVNQRPKEISYRHPPGKDMLVVSSRYSTKRYVIVYIHSIDSVVERRFHRTFV